MEKLSNEERINAMLFIRLDEGVERIRAYTIFNEENDEDYAKWQEFLNKRGDIAPVVPDDVWCNYIYLYEKYKKFSEKLDFNINVKKTVLKIKKLLNDFFEISYKSEHQWYYIYENIERNTTFANCKSNAFYSEDERLFITD